MNLKQILNKREGKNNSDKIKVIQSDKLVNQDEIVSLVQFNENVYDNITERVSTANKVVDLMQSFCVDNYNISSLIFINPNNIKINSDTKEIAIDPSVTDGMVKDISSYYDIHNLEYFSSNICRHLNKEIIKKAKRIPITEEDIGFLLAYDIFVVLFGISPFCGMKYYSSFAYDNSKYLNVMANGLDFIFKDNSNNALIYGSNKIKKDLWEMLPMALKEFFIKGLSGEQPIGGVFLAWKDFWKCISRRKLGCGEEYLLFLSPDEGVLIFSENTIAPIIVDCLGKGAKCKDCIIPKEKRIIYVPSVKTHLWGNENKDIYLFEGYMIQKQNSDTEYLGEVIESQKIKNLLGLKNISEKEWEVIDEKGIASRISNGQIVKLIEGSTIKIDDDIFVKVIK